MLLLTSVPVESCNAYHTRYIRNDIEKPLMPQLLAEINALNPNSGKKTGEERCLLAFTRHAELRRESVMHFIDAFMGDTQMFSTHATKLVAERFVNAKTRVQGT